MSVTIILPSSSFLIIVINLWESIGSTIGLKDGYPTDGAL